MNETIEAVAEVESVDAAVEGQEPSAEDRGLVLLEVVQAALALALDSGVSPDVKELRLVFKEGGEVAVVALDEADVEVEVVISTEQILELIDA